MKTTSAAGMARVLCVLPLLAVSSLFIASASAQTWNSADIGAVGAAGSSSVSGGVYTVRGAGEDVWGPRDEFHYHYRTWTGDGMLIVRVTSVQFTFNWAKAGVMIRSALTDNAQHAYAFVSPEQNFALVYRTEAGGNTTSPTAVDFAQKSMPVWLRLVRAGSSIVMDYSNDGTYWFRHNNTTIAFPQTIHVGLAVNSHVDATLCTATFDNLTVDTIRPTQLVAMARSPSKVFLRWQDNDVDETGFEIERSTDGVNFTRVGTAAAWSTPRWSQSLPSPLPPPASFADTTASASTTYQYRVRSITPRGPSAYSNVIAVTTPPPAPAGWNYEDIGETAAMGRSSQSGSVFTVAGAGSGVGSVTYRRPSQFKGDLGVFVPGFSDEFQFLWRSWTGEGEIVARVTGFSGATTGQAGVMVRTSSDASGFNVYAFGKPAGAGFGVTARPGTQTYPYEHFYYVRETTSYHSTTSSPPPPFWLKLERLDDGVLSYRSDDGVNWTYLGWVRTPLASEVQFGLGVSSQNDGLPPALPAVLSTTFDNVRVGTITTPPPPPAPPTNLRATDVRQNYIQIEWTNPDRLYDGVEMERSTDGANFTFVGRTNTAMLFQSDVAADTTYYFRGRTVRGSTFSAYSTVLTVRTPAMPAAPSNLAATVLSSTEIRLTWTDNATNEEGQQIERSTDNVSFVFFAHATANATSHTATGLTPNTSYYFRVRAYVTAGASGYSNVASATTFASGTTAPTNLAATAISSTRVDLTWSDNSADETGFQVERMSGSTAPAFFLLATVAANTRSFSDNSVNGSESYTYRVRAVANGTFSTYSNTASVTTPANPPTGDSWQTRDIGAVAAAGSSSESGGTVTLRASGADIWNTADEFHYRFQPWSGDGTITVRVTGLTNTHGWAKAGVMFRESLAAGSRHAMMIVSISHGTALQYREATGGESGSSTPTGVGTLPRWLRLVRSGNTFTGFESTNGTSWTQAGTITLTGLPSEIYVGLAATSHNDGVVTTATFDNVSVTSPTAPSPLPAPSNLAAVATSSTQIDLTWNDNSSDETGFSIERSTNGTSFTAWTTVGANVRSVSNTGLTPSTTYWYRVAARRGETVSAFSNTASAATSATTPPPPPGNWQTQDIGAVASTGSSSESGGRVTVTGSGADIWNTADEFHYRHQPWNGDGEIVARITAVQNTDSWAKAGVMMRASLNANAPNVFIYANPSFITGWQHRSTVGGATVAEPKYFGSPPAWVKLVRAGNVFTAHRSHDGVTWTNAGSVTIPMGSTIYVGLAVTSHNDGVNCTATFENVSLTGGGTPPATPPNPPTNLTAAATSSSQINLTWSDNSTNETGFEVESSTDNTNYTRVTTTTANVTSFSHTGLSASTTYFYRVRAVNAAGPSSYTAPVSATTQAGSTPPPDGSWMSQDIGAVGMTGATTESGGTMTVRGSGHDIWDTVDAFRFVHRTLTGDGQIVARVTSVQNTDSWAKVGVMMRAALTANAPNAFIYANPSFVTGWQHRATAGGTTTAGTKYFGWAPAWMKLVRAGNVFTAHRSHDGVTWTEIGSVTVSMPSTIYVGLAVTSHNNAALCSGVFDNVALTGGSTPPPSINAPSGLSATAASSTQINLAWTDNSTNETEFQIQRSPDNAAWTTIATRGANTTSYSDATVSAGTTYYYRVRAAASGTTSNWSNTSSATTPGATPPPPTWSFGDIGTVGVAGSNESGGNTITIRGSGADVWDTADGFRFVYRTMTGDCTVEALVSSLTNTHAWAKAGVMIRESTAANARNVFALVTPANGVHAQHRATAGGATVSTAGQWWVGPPRWVRLVRTGNRIIAFWSTNGTSWTQFATYDVTFGATALVGFAVTSHNNTQLATAVFTDPFVQ